jgi:hypothetical protein
MKTVCPKYVPPDLVEWFEAIEQEISGPVLDIYRRLICDARMSSVWRWYKRSTRFPPSSYPEGHVGTSPYLFCWHVRAAMVLPPKPGDMPPKERSKYLIDVKRHAKALAALLVDTRFDATADDSPSLSVDELAVPLRQAVSPSWPGNEGPVFAFHVDGSTVRSAGSGYPETHLVEQLRHVVSWASAPDGWGRKGEKSSEAITRSRTAGSRVSYFTRTLYDSLSRCGYSIPFAILATLANVALELGADESVDEDTVGKQVGRYRKRIAGAPPDTEGEV